MDDEDELEEWNKELEIGPFGTLAEILAWPGRSRRLLDSIKRTIGFSWNEDYDDDWCTKEEYCSEEEEQNIHGEAADPDEEALLLPESEVVYTDWPLYPEEDISCPDDRCVALERLLSRKNQTSIFKDTLGKVLYKVIQLKLRNVAEVLLKFNPDCNYEDTESYSALHLAVRQDDTALIKMLVDKGADIDAEQSDVAPLELAFIFHNLECAQTLLDLGASTRDRFKGHSILLDAFDSNVGTESIIGLLKQLLQKGADPNVVLKNGRSMESSLSSCVSKGNEEDKRRLCKFMVKVTRLLLLYGFTPSCCNNEGILCMSLRHLNSLFPLAGLLLEHGVPFCPGHTCWSRCDVLMEAITINNDIKARLNDVLKKANFVMDLATVHPPVFRFTFEGEVLSAVPAPLQSLCMATVRNLLLPWPLDDKVQALPISQILKDILLPLKKV